MRLQICIQVAAIVSFFMVHVYAAPVIQSIVNNSDFGFVILEHSDASDCSLSDCDVVIDDHSKFTHEFLLEIGKPSIVLRPVYYKDPFTKKKIWFVDDSYHFNFEKIKEVYDLWFETKRAKKFKTVDDWLNHWIGRDITVIPHEVEISGYLINLSRVVVKNNKKISKSYKDKQVAWLSFAKGIFSKLVIGLDINQTIGKGIYPTIQVFHGEGGVCSNGIVERI
ncbi:hypothetical protein KBB68_01815 [Candidatus Babeliales bacterium]|nr:hypothetical protein [Candidatus Babeliales bacterium]